MKVEPQGRIILHKTPLESDYKNQLTFVNRTAQIIYFNSTVVKVFDENTYIRKDGGLKINCNIEEIRQCNYLSYWNGGFDNRTYYCFITKLKYLSENSTLVEYETDVFQTWLFDMHLNPCFVEREHVSDDTAGLHTVPESLETGEYNILELRNSPMFENEEGDLFDPFFTCFCVTNYPDNTEMINGEPSTVGGVFSSLHFFAVEQSKARTIIDIYNLSQTTTAEAIKNIFVVPRCCVNINSKSTHMVLEDGTPSSAITGDDGTTSKTARVFPLHDSFTSGEFKLQQPNVLSGEYHPKNNKLFTYPYQYFYVSNNTGGSSIYRWEDFPIETLGTGQSQNTARTCTYRKAFVPSAGISAKLYFTNYKGYSDAGQGYGGKLYDYGVNFSKVPVCAWTTDYYTNWLTQNGVNIATNIVSGAVTGFASGALMGLGTPIGGVLGGAIGASTSLVKSIGSMVGETHKAETTPDNAKGNINTGDLVFGYIKNSISFYGMSVRPEMARIIDDYFSMFGYKVNIVKIPEFMTRPNWNFIKTIGCNIDGEIPQEDLNTIRKMFDTGITLWHHAETMYDYTQNNKN